MYSNRGASMKLQEASERNTPPGILFADIPDQNIRTRVENLDREIQFRPLVFLAILGNDKKAATLLNPGNERRDDSSTITPVGDSPRSLLREYYMNDFDRWVEFDPETEDIIAGNEEHRKLLQEVQSAKNRVIKLGPMKSELRPNLEAPALRDQVRINRLGLYVGEVATFSVQQEAQVPSLPSAV
jgi:hypothetical protein